MPTTRPILSARNADPLRLYELAVQEPSHELDMVTRWFRRITGRPLRRLREDFCGTAFTACTWVRSDPRNSAVGLDLHARTLAWARRLNLAPLPKDARSRITLLRSDVLHPPPAARGADAVLAMNFSWSVFKTRQRLRNYFASVRRSLARDGVFFLDIHGGHESMKELTERRRCAGFTYVWEQARYDPISGDLTCHIHFDFKRGPMLRRAFTYHWRLWTLPEVRELLAEAGFRHVTVYWERENKHGNGTGVFAPRTRGEADASFVAVISAAV
jgi:SAM-dependent methyltransferase